MTIQNNLLSDTFDFTYRPSIAEDWNNYVEHLSIDTEYSMMVPCFYFEDTNILELAKTSVAFLTNIKSKDKELYSDEERKGFSQVLIEIIKPSIFHKKVHLGLLTRIVHEYLHDSDDLSCVKLAIELMDLSGYMDYLNTDLIYNELYVDITKDSSYFNNLILREEYCDAQPELVEATSKLANLFCTPKDLTYLRDALQDSTHLLAPFVKILINPDFIKQKLEVSKVLDTSYYYLFNKVIDVIAHIDPKYFVSPEHKLVFNLGIMDVFDTLEHLYKENESTPPGYSKENIDRMHSVSKALDTQLKLEFPEEYKEIQMKRALGINVKIIDILESKQLNHIPMVDMPELN